MDTFLKNNIGSSSIIGRTFEADFGEKKFTLNYEDIDTLILTETEGPQRGRVQRLHVSIVTLRPNLFMVNWQEDTKLTNTDIEDYENGVVYANMTTPSGNFITLRPAYPEPGEAPPPAVEPPPQAAEPETPRVPRPHHAAAQPRKPKGVVVLAIGLPGSGKSTWFKRRGAVPLSSDVIRSMLFDDVTEQRFQDLVFSTLRSLLRARLVARMPLNYVDATNLSPHDRRGWIKMARDFGYEVQAVFFDVPTEVCMERNARRNRVVPEDVMQRMAGKLKPPKFEEGFSKITVVRVKRAPGDEGSDSAAGDAELQE